MAHSMLALHMKQPPCAMRSLIFQIFKQKRWYALITKTIVVCDPLMHTNCSNQEHTQKSIAMQHNLWNSWRKYNEGRIISDIHDMATIVAI